MSVPEKGLYSVIRTNKHCTVSKGIQHAIHAIKKTLPRVKQQHLRTKSLWAIECLWDISSGTMVNLHNDCEIFPEMAEKYCCIMIYWNGSREHTHNIPKLESNQHME